MAGIVTHDMARVTWAGTVLHHDNAGNTGGHRAAPQHDAGGHRAVPQHDMGNSGGHHAALLGSLQATPPSPTSLRPWRATTSSGKSVPLPFFLSLHVPRPSARGCTPCHNATRHVDQPKTAHRPTPCCPTSGGRTPCTAPRRRTPRYATPRTAPRRTPHRHAPCHNMTRHVG